MGKEFCLIILLFQKIVYGNIIQLDPVLSVQEGDNVILSCFIPKEQIMLTGIGSFNLTIMKAKKSDAATYFCAITSSNIIYFGNGTLLIIEGAEISKHHILQLPKFKTESEINVPLQCLILTKTLNDEKHPIYWFKHNSEKSHLGTIYIQGNTNDSCLGDSEADCYSRKCIYNLNPNRNSSCPDFETYYCALAMCGEVLFGNFSKNTADNIKSVNMHLISQISLAILLAMGIAINILLYCKRNDSKLKEIQNTDAYYDGDDVSKNKSEEMTYTAVKFSTKHSRVKMETSPDNTLYSGLACQQHSLNYY
ncbi:uncharacterized protein [Misgurnus anguillicaudatus]|uniref:uncharacterized protein isoform X2 n=1 Tax=Misgurnus anguillicaudatus TaxID=75329 RepID=UPI003CCF3B2F